VGKKPFFRPGRGEGKGVGVAGDHAIQRKLVDWANDGKKWWKARVKERGKGLLGENASLSPTVREGAG